MYRFTDYFIASVYRALDTLVALTSLTVVLVVLNMPGDARQLSSFLEFRVSLKNVLLVAAMTILWPKVFSIFGLYRFSELHTFRIELGRIVRACIVGSLFAVAVALTSVSGAFGFASVGLFLVVVTAGTVCVRAIGRRTLLALTGVHSSRPMDVLLVGSGPRAVHHFRHMLDPRVHRPIGFIDIVAPPPLPFGVDGPPCLGTIDDLERLLISRDVDAVHIALPVKSCYSEIARVIAACDQVGVEFLYDAELYPRSRTQARPDHAGHVAMKVVVDDYRFWLKRLIDIAGASAALMLLSPVLAAASFAVWYTSPGPILFAQERFGFNRRRFTMYKFRTMVADASHLQSALEAQNEAAGPIFKIKNDPRITPVGRFLRKTSIDELPQLLNVLRGEMSLVGPRPMSVRDVERFDTVALMRRFCVRPGLTCLWQINGRSNTDFSRWIELDLAYIDNWSLALDMRILVKTVPAVLSGTGAM